MGEVRGARGAEDVLRTQRAYYDLRAPDYADTTKPADRAERGLMDAAMARRLIDELGPTGDVLELACGAGAFTRELAGHAGSLTAVDGSARMLERNRETVADPRVVYICADLFDWTPPVGYDLVFFGFWLSHVPPTHFESFWNLVASCLRPDGRVAFVDEDQRAAVHERVIVEGDLPLARRTLSDGRTFDIIKVFWSAIELEARLGQLGWQVTVAPVGDTFLYGVGSRS